MFSQEEKPNQCNQTKCNVLGLILLLKNRHRFLLHFTPWIFTVGGLFPARIHEFRMTRCDVCLMQYATDLCTCVYMYYQANIVPKKGFNSSK